MVGHSRDGHVRGHLPPSLYGLFPPEDRGIVDAPGLMGRILNADALARSLSQPAGQPGTSLRQCTIHVLTSSDPVEISLPLPAAETAGDAAIVLTEEEFGQLLLHGYDTTAGELLGGRLDHARLHAMFPEQDFVIWQADAF